jgi:hypothetical protein
MHQVLGKGPDCFRVIFGWSAFVPAHIANRKSDSPKKDGADKGNLSFHSAA